MARMILVLILACLTTGCRDEQYVALKARAHKAEQEAQRIKNENENLRLQVGQLQDQLSFNSSECTVAVARASESANPNNRVAVVTPQPGARRVANTRTRGTAIGPSRAALELGADPMFPEERQPLRPLPADQLDVLNGVAEEPEGNG